MILAEFNPMMLFLLLWGMLSWLTKKKKNQLKEKDQGEYSEMEPKEDLFTRIQKLQDHFSNEAEIFPLDPDPAVVEENYFSEDDKNSFEESKIFTPTSVEADKDEKYVFETDIKVSPKRSANWLKQNLSGKSELRKLIVLKEILGKPRSIYPYTGDYYQ